MKSPITWLPTLMLLGLAGGFFTHPSVAFTQDHSADRNAEISGLRQELKSMEARLEALEEHGHAFIPRGGLGPASR